MAVTGTVTVREIVTAALKRAQITDISEAANADDAEVARSELNRMLKSWQNKGYNLWYKTGGSLALTTAASYTLSPVRPFRILSARFSDGTTERPMNSMTRDEYDDLPNKSTTGTPTQFYYDRQREAAVFYIWPALASASGETIEYTYERETEDIADLDDTLDAPGEWWDAITLNLSVRISEIFGVPPSQTTVIRADQELMLALGSDREESVFIGPDEYRW